MVHLRSVHWDVNQVIAGPRPADVLQKGGSLGSPRRRVLLVPGSSSASRQAAATACATTLEALGWSASILDATWMGSHGWGPGAEVAFRRVLTVPGLHDALHYAALRSGNQLAQYADAVTRLRLVPRLRDYLDRHPAELVISISPAGASAVSTVAPRYPFMRPLVLCTDAFPPPGPGVLGVAGQNNRLENKLRDVARRHRNVLVFGFTDRVPELMAASDLVITIPGSTCMEARTVGRPLLLLDLVHGHGRDDLLYELELGDAAVTSKGPAYVVRSALAFLERIKPAPAGPTRSLADWEDKLRLALRTGLH